MQIDRKELPYSIPGDCLLKPLDDESGDRPDVIVLDKQKLSDEPPWQKESIVTLGSCV